MEHRVLSNGYTPITGDISIDYVCKVTCGSSVLDCCAKHLRIGVCSEIVGCEKILYGVLEWESGDSLSGI